MEFQRPLNLKIKIKLYKLYEETKPNRIIHLAAMTDVDLCETEQRTGYYNQHKIH